MYRYNTNSAQNKEKKINSNTEWHTINISQHVQHTRVLMPHNLIGPNVSVIKKNSNLNIG